MSPTGTTTDLVGSLGSLGRRFGLRRARMELDDELALERVGDLQERVDPRRAAAALEARDRRLRRADELCELALRHALRVPLRGDLLGDCGEEPAAVARRDALAQPLERPDRFR